ncbi:MAG TPA: hypothetical protein VNT30_18950 [Stellaceae bacterium]|nr:hypothetical protein [Stellaceae bacterium]
MTPTRSSDANVFARLTGRDRIWAISSIHGESRRLASVHAAIAARLQPGDGLVYLGNFLGRGSDVRGTFDELLAFRLGFLARPGTFACDVAYLRGSQEEMWQKLLQLQFAPNPFQVLEWMIDHGLGPTLAAYGGDLRQGQLAARDGAVSITRWTNGLRAALNSAPGHANLMTALRRAAFTGDDGVLFVNAGLDPSRPLTAQSDSLWWGGANFLDLEQPYGGFRRVVRGYDRHHGGIQETRYAVSLDRGAGFGGPLVAACFDPSGSLLTTLEV